MGLIFSDFEIYSKSAPGKISLSIVLVLYTYEIGKTAKNKAGYTAISCGRVGRGRNARFPTFRLDGYGRTDGPTDRWTDRQTD